MAQVTQGAASKLGKIKQTRKNIARVLTVINQKAMESYRKEVEGAAESRKPKALRAKKTRALRRALTKEQVRDQLQTMLYPAHALHLFRPSASHLVPPHALSFGRRRRRRSRR